MGLSMTLSLRVEVGDKSNKYNHEKYLYVFLEDEKHKILANNKFRREKDNIKMYALVEIGCWRNAYQIDELIKNFLYSTDSDGVEFILCENTLRNLKKVCKCLLFEDKQANGIFPTIEEFSRQDIDCQSWYKEQLERTIEIVDNAIEICGYYQQINIYPEIIYTSC